MKTLDEDVAAFHRKFNHPAPEMPITLSTEVTQFRIDRIEEECKELCEALRRRNLAEIAAESVDLIYVVLGTLVCCGLRIAPFWRVVHAANMAKKENPNGGKPLKPKGWIKPDCKLVLLDVPMSDKRLLGAMRVIRNQLNSWEESYFVQIQGFHDRHGYLNHKQFDKGFEILRRKR